MLKVFTLLIFQGTDSVSEVRTVRADSGAQARRIAEMIMQTHPAAAGHQLWRDGTCIARTYPTMYPGTLAPNTAAGNAKDYGHAAYAGSFASNRAMSSAGE